MPILERVFVVILFVSVASTVVSVTLAVDDEGVVAVAIDRAETAVISAYNAVWWAEQAGANVSALLVRLNLAGEHLANARILRLSGDYTGAIRSADLSFDATANVIAEAYGLRDKAQRRWEQTLWAKMITSTVATISIGFLGYLSWRVFKQRYQKQILGMKPEAGPNAS